MKRRVFSIIFLMLLSIYIGSATIKAAPPEGFNFNHVLKLIWTDQDAISQEGEFHLVSDEIDGMSYTIPMLANWLLTADMGDVIGAFNDVGAIYPGHSEAYAYYIFMVDIEELHFYSYKMQLKKTVPFDELVSVTTDDPLIPNHTVSVQYNVDNEIYEIQIVNKGSQLTFPDDPEKENHVFVGWYLDPLFYYAYDPASIVVNGFQLYAKFELEDLTINFYNGDYLHKAVQIQYGNKIILDSTVNIPVVLDQSKTIYSSNLRAAILSNENELNDNGTRWFYSENASYNDNGDLETIEAFDIKTIKLTTRSSDNKNDGSIKLYISEDKDEWIELYSYVGKNTTPFSVSRNVNINSSVYVRILANKMFYTKIEFVTDVDTETRKKNVFENWYYDEKLTLPYHEDDIFTSDTNLYAGYVEKKFELSFDSNDGSPVTSQFYYEDDEIVIPEYNPSKIGYVFAGWYLDEELEQEFNLETMPGDDVVLYARWEETQAVQYLIEFYLGEDLYIYIVVEEDQQLILPSAPPTAENQIFLGWYYDEEFTEQFKVTDPIEDDVTLYGKFGSGGSGGTETPPEETPGTEFKLEKKYVIIAAIVFIGIGLALIIRKRK